jgi:hypothetical protein
MAIILHIDTAQGPLDRALNSPLMRGHGSSQAVPADDGAFIENNKYYICVYSIRFIRLFAGKIS